MFYAQSTSAVISGRCWEENLLADFSFGIGGRGAWSHGHGSGFGVKRRAPSLEKSESRMTASVLK